MYRLEINTKECKLTISISVPIKLTKESFNKARQSIFMPYAVPVLMSGRNDLLIVPSIFRFKINIKTDWSMQSYISAVYVDLYFIDDYYEQR